MKKALTKTQLREHIIGNGVRNLQEFGYPTANRDNILTDYVFKAFFLRMLKEVESPDPLVKEVVSQLIKEVGSEED